jgi:hypothetical protein
MKYKVKHKKNWIEYLYFHVYGIDMIQLVSDPLMRLTQKIKRDV